MRSRQARHSRRSPASSGCWAINSEGAGAEPARIWAKYSSSICARHKSDLNEVEAGETFPQIAGQLGMLGHQFRGCGRRTGPHLGQILVEYLRQAQVRSE